MTLDDHLAANASAAAESDWTDWTDDDWEGLITVEDDLSEEAWGQPRQRTLWEGET